MNADGLSYPNVETAFHRDEAGGRYLFGVIVHGEFVPLLEHKLGRIDKLIAAGKKREAAQPPPSESAAPQGESQ